MTGCCQGCVGNGSGILTVSIDQVVTWVVYEACVTGTGQHSSVWHICVTGTFYMTHVSLGHSIWPMCHWDLLYDACVTWTGQHSSVWHICVTGTFYMTHVSLGQDNILLFDTSLLLGHSILGMCHWDRTTLFCLTHLCHWDILYDACVTGTGQHSSVWHIFVTGTFYIMHVPLGQDNTLLFDTSVSLGLSIWRMCHWDRTTLFCLTHLRYWNLL